MSHYTLLNRRSCKHKESNRRAVGSKSQSSGEQGETGKPVALLTDVLLLQL